MLKNVSTEGQILAVLVLIVQLVQGTLVVLRTDDTVSEADVQVLETKVNALENKMMIVEELRSSMHRLELQLARIPVDQLTTYVQGIQELLNEKYRREANE